MLLGCLSPQLCLRSLASPEVLSLTRVLGEKQESVWYPVHSFDLCPAVCAEAFNPDEDEEEKEPCVSVNILAY